MRVLNNKNNEYIQIHEPDYVSNSRWTKLSHKTFKTTYQYNFKTIFNSHKKLYKNDLNFLRKFSRKNNDSTTLVTLDIKRCVL